jgi:type VI protein secretion system component Hcp
MAQPKKKITTKNTAKLKDLRPKKDPKGGEVFLKIEGIKGESQDGKSGGSIEVNSWT